MSEMRAVLDLRGAARLFFSRPGPRRIATKAAAAWAARALSGPPSGRDLAAVAGVVLWWPLQEWLGHKYLLHRAPRAGGPAPDLDFARRHRAHHRDPANLELTLLPLEVVHAAMIVNVASWLLLTRDRKTALTGIASYCTAALIYEWTHFLVHTSYRPKGRAFSRVHRNHRNHHFRNENYWFGFTLPLVDRLLGTEPDPKGVPVSATARDLFGLGDEAH